MFTKKWRINTTKVVIYSVVVLIIVTGSIYTTFFLYDNFYKTLASSHKVKVLKKEWNVETSNIRRFQEIKEQLERKNKTREINISIDFN